MDQTFHAFGACIVRTPLPVQALPAATASNTASIIDIDWGTDGAPHGTEWCHHWRDGEDVVLSLARQGADYWLRFPDLADFRLQMAPHRILVAAEPGTDATTLEHLLVDQVLPRLLAQQGHLLVHASALAIAGRHALFLGPSGGGKSTLAGLLQHAGHAVLSDDCVQLEPDGERFKAIPTYPSLRLYADSIEEVFPQPIESTPVASYSDKRRIPVAFSGGDGTGVPVDALYLLGDPTEAGETIRIAPLRPAQACEALLRHSFRLDLGDRAATASHFTRCSAVARAVPAFHLDYPRDFALRDPLVRSIAEHLTHLPASI